MWVYAITNADPMLTQKFSPIAIQFLNTQGIDGNKLMYTCNVDFVELKVYGRTVQVSKIKASDIEAIADLSNISTEGTYTVEVIIKGVPESLDKEITPRYLTIEVSKLTEKKSNYTIDLKGTLEEGYAVLGHKEDTKNVSISGSAVATSNVDKIIGEIDLSGKNTDFTSYVTLIAYDKNGSKLNNVTISPQQITSNVSVGKTKIVDLITATTGACAAGYAVEKVVLNPTQITIAGKEDILASLGAIHTEDIEVSDRDASFSKTVNLVVPDGIVIVSTAKITANITIQQLIEKTFTYDSLQIRNTPINLSCDLSAFSSLDMTIQGFASDLDAITKDKIVIYIDLNNMSEGSYTMDILYELPDDILLKAISLTKVEVTLTKQ